MSRIVGVVLSVLVLLLAGCAGGGSGSAGSEAAGPAEPSPSGSGAGSAPPGDALSLVGLWTLEGTDEEPGTVLRVTGTEVSLWRACGALMGEWIGADGLFVASFHGSTGGCPAPASGSDFTPGWVLKATGYRADGAARLLVDASGATVARLVPGGTPKVGSDIDPSMAAPPVVTDEDRTAHAAPAPLRAGLTPADRTAIVGRWVQVRGSSPAFVEFAADGRWTGSDGCNGLGGRWTLGPGGTLLSTGGPTTLIACDGLPVGTWVGQTRRAGLDNGVLVLQSAAGTELGRLRRA